MEEPFYCENYRVEGLTFTAFIKRQINAGVDKGRVYRTLGLLTPENELCRGCVQGANVIKYAKISGLDLPKAKTRRQTLTNAYSKG